jgi:NADH-quinone oxidoreductase subunit M
LPTDLNTREVLTLVPLAALCLLLGVYPKPVINALTPAVSSAVRTVHENAATSRVPFAGTPAHDARPAPHNAGSHGEAHP